jgi:hypothetical protein
MLCLCLRRFADFYAGGQIDRARRWELVYSAQVRENLSDIRHGTDCVGQLGKGWQTYTCSLQTGGKTTTWSLQRVSGIAFRLSLPSPWLCVLTSDASVCSHVCCLLLLRVHGCSHWRNLGNRWLRRVRCGRRWPTCSSQTYDFWTLTR